MFHISMPSKKKHGSSSPDTASPRITSPPLDPSTNGTVPSNTNSMPPPTSTSRLHSLGRAKSRETSSASTSRTSSPSPADDPALIHNQPKRTSSFRTLGLTSLGSGLTRAAGEVVHGMGKKEKEKVEAVGASSVPSTPPISGGYFNFNSGSNGNVTTPDPSHLADFSLSLSELVNKAFAPCSAGSTAAGGGGILPSGVTSASGGVNPSSVKPKKKQSAPPLSSISYEGRRLPEKSKVVEISELITKELMYASSVDSYLLRAVSRQALKALTLFSNRIDGLLIPLSRENGAMKIPSNAKEGNHLPNALEFNLGLVTLEWIVEDALERCLDGRMETDLGLDTGMPPFVSEILTPVRQKMERTILHVIQPLLTGVKSSLTTCINQAISEPFAPNLSSTKSGPLGSSNSPHRSPQGLSPTILPTNPNAPLPTPTKEGGGTSLLGRSDHSISQSSPAWLKELEARLEGARALLVPRIEERCGQDGEGWFISVVIHLIWKGLVVMSSRTSEPFGSKCYNSTAGVTGSSAERILGRPFTLSKEGTSSSRAPSPAQLSNAIKAVSLGGKKVGSNRDSSLPPSGRSTPSASISEGNPTTNPINQASTIPSRSSPSKSTLQQISELQTFEKLVCRFARGFVPSSSIPGSLRGRLGNSLSNKNASSGVMVDGEESDSDSSSDDEEDELARAALAEAVQAVKSTTLVLQHIDTIPTFTLNALCRSRGCAPSLSTCEGIPNATGFTTPTSSLSGTTSPNATPISTSTSNVTSTTAAANATVPAEVLKAFKAIPPLILLHLVYSRLPRSSQAPSSTVSSSSSEDENSHCSPGLQILSPPGLFGYSWQEYEKAIAGFNGGETWAAALVNGWKESLQTEWSSLLEREKSLTIKEEARAKNRKAFNRNSINGGTEVNRESDLPSSTNNEGALDSEDLLASTNQMQRSMSVASSDSETSVPEAMTRSAPTLEKEKSTPTAVNPNDSSSKPDRQETKGSASNSPEISPPPTSHGRIQTSSGPAGESLGAARDALLQRQASAANSNSVSNPNGVPEGHSIISRSSTGESENNGSSALPSPGLGLPASTSTSNLPSTTKPRFWRSTSSQRTFHLPSLSRTASPRGTRGGSEISEIGIGEDHLISSLQDSSNPNGNPNQQASLMLGPNGEWIQINQEDKLLLKEREQLNLERFGLILFKKTLAAVGQTTGTRIE